MTCPMCGNALPWAPGRPGAPRVYCSTACVNGARALQKAAKRREIAEARRAEREAAHAVRLAERAARIESLRAMIGNAA